MRGGGERLLLEAEGAFLGRGGVRQITFSTNGYDLQFGVKLGALPVITCSCTKQKNLDLYHVTHSNLRALAMLWFKMLASSRLPRR